MWLWWNQVTNLSLVFVLECLWSILCHNPEMSIPFINLNKSDWDIWSAKINYSSMRGKNDLFLVSKSSEWMSDKKARCHIASMTAFCNLGSFSNECGFFFFFFLWRLCFCWNAWCSLPQNESSVIFTQPHVFQTPTLFFILWNRNETMTGEMFILYSIQWKWKVFWSHSWSGSSEWGTEISQLNLHSVKKRKIPLLCN